MFKTVEMVSRLRMDGSMGWTLLCIAEDLGNKNIEMQCEERGQKKKKGKRRKEKRKKREEWGLRAMSSF